MDDRHSMTIGGLKATVLMHGAELCSLRGKDGVEAIWQAGPPWPRHAPVLFPIVGKLANDTLRMNGRDYPMTQHGFARDHDFAWVSRTDTACRLTLTDGTATRARYPFGFRLDIEYELRADTLHMNFIVENTGTVPLPASLGAHPAFNWPLLPGDPKEAYELVFSDNEPGPVWNVADGTLTHEPVASPIHDGTLPLRARIGTDDTTILHPPASHSVTYGPLGRPMVRVGWKGFPELAIWSRHDADLVCIEPWIGFTSPVGFDGDFRDKPGIFMLDPGASRTATMHISIIG